MKISPRACPAAISLCLFTVLALAAPPLAAAKQPYESFGSCGSRKPFKQAHRCRYDGPEEARGTFVFKSNVGKRQVKVCQKITGVPFDRKHQCLKAGRFAYKAVPFTFSGASAPIEVTVTWFVKEPGGSGGFAKAATARLKFVP